MTFFRISSMLDAKYKDVAKLHCFAKKVKVLWSLSMCFYVWNTYVERQY